MGFNWAFKGLILKTYKVWPHMQEDEGRVEQIFSSYF
jgi:hypothetical protein